MAKVVETVRRARGDDPEPTAGDDHWRPQADGHRHDPLKPVGAASDIS